jgi:hypothetical protein
MMKTSGYVRSGNSAGTNGTRKKRDPFSVTNDSLFKDEDDAVPLHDVERGQLKNGQISKGMHIEVAIGAKSDDEKRRPAHNQF